MGEAPELEQKEERLAGAYLTQAMQGLFDTGRSAALFQKGASFGDSPAKRELIHRMVAASRQTEFSRMSILFSTLAAEAYANQFLSEHLSGRDLDALDRLPFHEKLVLAPQVAVGRRLFHRGEEPMQSIDRLHGLRRHLVHPKPRVISVKKHHLYERPGSDDYNPQEAARALIAVARVAVGLSEIPEAPSPPDGTAAHLSSKATEIFEFADSAIELPRKGRRLRRIRRKPRIASKVELPKIPSTRLTDLPEESEGTDTR